MTAQIIRLPGAAAEPVKQGHLLGRRPKCIVSFEKFLAKKRAAERVVEQIKKLQTFIEGLEGVQQGWRDEIDELRQDGCHG